ncbi:hypothetical protein AB4865_04595 [Capnocytophaga sp. ARDL2]|uniref:hypothetical protein n=1 Tax=Capnocytophaga sp. ARDL2 TaxID=3238809 RepID=UPI003558655F
MEISKGTELRFSRDTVYMDTIFSNTSSSTYTLKVYNNSNKDIIIPSVYLKKGAASKYRISLDGLSGKSFNNFELLAKDSAFIFIETTVDINQHTSGNEFLYTDELIFQSGSNQQEVHLVSLIKDAVFLYPQKYNINQYETITVNDEEIYGFFLDENDAINGNELHWTDEKPYVVYGYAAIPPAKQLTIDAGTQIHFHNNSGLLAFPTSEIEVNGTVANPVVFQGDRLEPAYKEIPGQWNTILLAPNSKGTIKNAIIKNANIGLFANTQTDVVQLENLQIYNCSSYGLVGQAAKINGKNIVTNNLGQAALALSYGGDYTFTHCTFANFWGRSGHTSVAMDNGDGSAEFALNARFYNSIIYSNTSESLLLRASDNQQNFNFIFDHCIIKFTDTFNRVFNQYPYNFDNNQRFSQCLIARTQNEFAPHFENTHKNKMAITQKASSLIGYAAPQYLVPFDIEGNTRTSPADLGAYNHKVITE